MDRSKSERQVRSSGFEMYWKRDCAESWDGLDMGRGGKMDLMDKGWWGLSCQLGEKKGWPQTRFRDVVKGHIKIIGIREGGGSEMKQAEGESEECKMKGWKQCITNNSDIIFSLCIFAWPSVLHSILIITPLPHVLGSYAKNSIQYLFSLKLFMIY